MGAPPSEHPSTADPPEAPAAAPPAPSPAEPPAPPVSPTTSEPHRPLAVAVAVAGAAAAGLSLCFALPPWGWWPLAPVGVALWIAVLADRSRRQRAALSWLVGVMWFGPSTLWMAELTLPGYILGVLLGWGGMVAVVGALCPADRRRIVALPALLVGFEWFHLHAPFGGVPLSMLATTQTRAPLLPIARLGGVLLLGLAVSTLGAAFYLIAERRWRPAAITVAAVAAVALVSAVWPLGDPVGHVRLAGVQGGGPQGTRYSAADAPVVLARHLEATEQIHGNGNVDVVVWPENVVNIGGRFADSQERRLITEQAARIGAPIVVGVVESVDQEHFVNYVVVVHPDGTVSDRFDKVRRVPFGEYVPMRWLFEPVAASSLPPRDQVPGHGRGVIRTDHGKMAVVISWEVFFGRRVREGVRDGGQVVLNPTNGSSYWLTQVQTQQVAASQLRAVESGRWVLQVAPTGFSAFVDPAGGVHQRTDVSEQAVIERTVARHDGTTPAQALGDLPALLIASGVLVWVFLRRRRRGIDSDGPPETLTPRSAT